MESKFNRGLSFILAVCAILLFGYYEYNDLNARIIKWQVNASDNRNLFYPEEHVENHKVEKAEDKADFTLCAKSALLLDATSNHVLYEKKGYDELPMASTTKIMTCIVALEKGKLDDVVTFSKHAASMPDVQLNAKTGAQFTLRDLLYSLMLESHNDTAVAIAEHVGGSVEGFAKLMNQKAKELGLSHTHFVTPNGLDAEGHYTTAYDLARLASYAIQNKKFVEITNTTNWTLTEVGSKSTLGVVNKNRFLSLMQGAIGVKTGFTNNAGYCFVGALKRDGKTLVSVVLGCGWPPHKTYKWRDTELLMKYGLNHFSYVKINENLHELYDIPVEKGKTKFCPITMEKKDETLLLKNSDQIGIIYNIPKTIKAPVQSGQQVGSVKYYINGELYKEVPVMTTKSIAAVDYRYLLEHIIQLFFSFT